MTGSPAASGSGRAADDAGSPRLSVVMPVLNALPYLDEAVESILAQSFRDFEFVILDDGSSDGSAEALRGWAGKDDRIRLFLGETNRGPAGSSNFVVEQARAPLVARMDADDVAHPERLARQVALMNANPDVVLVGSLAWSIDGSGRRVRGADHARLVRKSSFPPFGHSSVLFRKSAFHRAGGYRPEADKWEDIDLYLRLAELGRVLTIPHPLMQVRHSRASSRLNQKEASFQEAMDLMCRCLAVHAQGGDYTPLLEAGKRPGKLACDAFYSVGATRLWAGERPRMLRQVLKRADLGLDIPSFRILAWAALASLYPAGLRAGLRALLGLRNRAASKRLRGEPAVEWRPPRARVS